MEKKSIPFLYCITKNGDYFFWCFFESFEYEVIRSDIAHLRGWNKYWYLRNYKKIFTDSVFQNNQVFEDARFWVKNFHKILYKKRLKAKHIFNTHNKNAWLESIVRFAHGGF